jgi:hypothetical protein
MKPPRFRRITLIVVLVALSGAWSTSVAEAGLFRRHKKFRCVSQPTSTSAGATCYRNYPNCPFSAPDLYVDNATGQRFCTNCSSGGGATCYRNYPNCPFSAPDLYVNNATGQRFCTNCN